MLFPEAQMLRFSEKIIDFLYVINSQMLVTQLLVSCVPRFIEQGCHMSFLISI